MNEQPPLPCRTPSTVATKTKKDDQEKAMEKSKTIDRNNAKALPLKNVNESIEKARQTQDPFNRPSSPASSNECPSSIYPTDQGLEEEEDDATQPMANKVGISIRFCPPI
ncbi:hypothetical protein Nepgr_003777 [Nepenthes gracilis]|uniref:Uncharacterized protein n=1 Tax=Nepenthes gracilis TaxID=150966 RepID=A0AAD3S094_NEPGR|nr:hypothetical protein Nepgr_003777 [Nepenthes gracilis]